MEAESKGAHSSKVKANKAQSSKLKAEREKNSPPTQRAQRKD